MVWQGLRAPAAGTQGYLQGYMEADGFLSEGSVCVGLCPKGQMSKITENWVAVKKQSLY